jgi:hypothetical protein
LTCFFTSTVSIAFVMFIFSFFAADGSRIFYSEGKTTHLVAPKGLATNITLTLLPAPPQARGSPLSFSLSLHCHPLFYLILLPPFSSILLNSYSTFFTFIAKSLVLS